MNEHRSCLPLRVHRLLLGLFLFLEGFQAEFIHHEICGRCDCNARDRSVACHGVHFDNIPTFPMDTYHLAIDGACFRNGLKNSMFTNFTQLRSVSLTNCCLTEVNFAAFTGIEKLVKIDMSRNFIKSIDQVDTSVVTLKELVLDNNSLTNIPGDTIFSITPNIEILSLKDNKITDITSFGEDFFRLPLLTKVDLSSNVLQNIPRFGFRHLPQSVRILDLSDCFLTEIDDDAFQNVSAHLTDLDLSGNHVNLNQIKGLFLGFKPGSALRRLRLARLDLEEIPPDPLWIRTPHLEVMDFSENWIEHVNYVAFNGLNLRELYLDSNRITFLPEVTNETYQLYHLGILSASNNRLTTFPALDLPRLYHVNFGRNRITQVLREHLEFMPRVQLINLTENAIVYIEPSAFTDAEVKMLDVSKNLLKNWEWLQKLRKLEYLNASHNTISSLSAELFISSGQTLMTLDLSSTRIREVDHGSFAPLAAIRHISLAENRFGDKVESGSLVNLFRDLQYLTSLDMSNLGLTSVPRGQFSNLTSLRSLFLSGNRIGRLCDTSSKYLGDTLTVFELRQNLLREIDTLYLKRLPSLKRVNFAQNPFHCDCQVDSFRQWINESQTEVVDFTGEGYACLSPASARGVPLRTFQANRDCRYASSFHFNVVLACFIASFLVLCTIVLLVIYKLKRCVFYKKPRYAYVGGEDFEWNSRRRVLHVLQECSRLVHWCPTRTRTAKIHLSHSQPLTERPTV